MRNVGALLMLQLSGGFAINEGAFGKPIEFPPVIASKTSTVDATLTFAEYTYVGPGLTQKTRAYNGHMAGPTIRVKPGDTVNVNLINKLPAAEVDTNKIHNHCRDPDKTNLHPHGLHVSPEAPGDDVMIVVKWNESYPYTYQIPPDHQGGTFWYHPHHHGSTNLQAGGGAGGFFIVDDPPGSLPPAVQSMEEMNLMLTNFDSIALQAWANKCIEACNSSHLSPPPTYAQCVATYSVWSGGPEAGGAHPTLPNTGVNTILVNGMSQPVISLVANRWYRWRLIFAAVQNTISPELAGCEVGLLAKDGVYLPTAPRPITAGFMGPGNRADWVVRCPAGSYSFISSGLLNPGAATGVGSDKQGPFNRSPAMVMATVVATEQGEAACDLGTFSVTRPCYLADLTGAAGGTAAVTPTKSLPISFPGMGISPSIDGAPGCPHQNKELCRFNASYFIDTWTTGTVNEYRVKGMDVHPFHTHVNPFQLATTPIDSAGGYFRAGDWHDTLQLPQANNQDDGWNGNEAKGSGLRGFHLLSPTDLFTGAQPFHCHLLEHEDQGMMAIIKMEGTEGARFDPTSLLKSGETCYTTAFDPAAHAPITRTAPTCSATSPAPPPSSAPEAWDAPAVTITILCSIALLVILVVAVVIIKRSGASPDASRGTKPSDVQITSAATPPA